MAVTLLVMFGGTWTNAADPLSPLARDLVADLSRQHGVDALDIQLGPENLTELETSARHPFSAALSEALAAELARRAAHVSLHETGHAPIRLTGHYQRHGEQLTVTLRLRRMGETGSNELAVASETVRLHTIPAALLQDSLSLVAASLIAQLERSPLAGDHGRIVVHQPVPARPGMPTLQLGSELKTALEQAVARSEILGLFAVIGDGPTLSIDADYITDDPVRITARLRQKNQKILGQASGSLARTELAPALFSMVADRRQEVCLSYEPADSRAVPTASPTSREVMAGLAAALNGFGILAGECTGNSAEIKVAASRQLGQKKLRDGYSLLTGELRLQLVEGGKPGALLTASERLPYTGQANDARPELARRLCTPQLTQQLAKSLLAYRPPLSPTP